GTGRRRTVDVARVAVAEEVLVVETPEVAAREPAADDASSERAASAVRIGEDGGDVPRVRAAVWLRALAVRPGVVAPRGDDVDLLDREIPDVCEPQLAGEGIEAEPEGVAEAVGEDLAALADLADERVVSLDGAVGDVEAQALAHEDVQVRGVRIGRGARSPLVVPDSGVADPDVELAVGPDAQAAAVVVAAVGLGAGEQRGERRRVHRVVRSDRDADHL